MPTFEEVEEEQGAVSVPGPALALAPRATGDA